MSDIKKLLSILDESTTAGSVSSVSTNIFADPAKRIPEDDSGAPHVIEYGNWENSALSTSEGVKKDRKTKPGIVKSIYGKDSIKESMDMSKSGPLKDIADYRARMKALQAIQMDPETRSGTPLANEVIKLRAMLNKEAKSRGWLNEDEYSDRGTGADRIKLIRKLRSLNSELETSYLELADLEELKSMLDDIVNETSAPGAENGIEEMDKSAPQPGRDGRVSHRTYGSRGDEDPGTGPEKIVKAVNLGDVVKKAEAELEKNLVQSYGKDLSENNGDKTPEYYLSLAKKHRTDGQNGTRDGMVYASKMAGRAARAAKMLKSGSSQEEAWRHYQGTDKQGVTEGAPELLKKEMPLHRHAEKLLAQNGVSKDDPDYHHHLANTIKHLRKFGNIDQINKQGVAEGGAETSWSHGTEKITLQDILDLTKHIKQINLPINDNLKSKLIQWDGNPEEIERINQVTVSNQFPILVMLDGQGQINWILDGNHRLHKAIRSQAETIPAKLIKPSDLSDKAKRIFHIKEQDLAEGKMAELDADLEDSELSDREFEKKYRMTRREAREKFSQTNTWDFPDIRIPGKKLHEQGVAEGYTLKKTTVSKYMEPGDPDEYTQDINIKDTDYEIINNKTGQVVGTASWTTNDFFGPGALKITMKNGATRWLDIWEREKGNPQTAFNRFVKDPKTSSKYKDFTGEKEGYTLKITNQRKYIMRGDPDNYIDDTKEKETNYNIINNKTGQVVGTANRDTGDYFAGTKMTITMNNGAKRMIDARPGEGAQSAFDRFVKDPKTAKKYKDQGVAEGSNMNVVKSVKVGNFRHDLVDLGFGWQVRIYNGDELYDTGLNKNSEQKGLAALDDAVAYTKKQLNIKEQGVAEGITEARFDQTDLLELIKITSAVNGGKLPEFPKEFSNNLVNTLYPVMAELEKSEFGKKVAADLEPYRAEAKKYETGNQPYPKNYAGQLQQLLGQAARVLDTASRQGVAEGTDKLSGTPVVSLNDLDDKDSKKDRYGRTVPKKLKKDDPRVKFHKEPKGQSVAEGSLNEGQYEMMLRNGQVKKFVAKDDADAKRIAAGHGAKSVIKLKGGVPAGKIAEQGVAEGSDFIIDPHNIEVERLGLLSKSEHGDHEIEMAKTDLYNASKSAHSIFNLIKDVPETAGLEGWVQEKITKAEDYLSTVEEYLHGKTLESLDGVGPSTRMFTSEGGVDEGKTGPGLWANIRKRRASGKRMRKPGEEGAPSDEALKSAREGSKNESADPVHGVCTECGGPAYSSIVIAEIKDACYRKVKSRYKVFPSAYASGALVKCRKVGAKNWGNKG